MAQMRKVERSALMCRLRLAACLAIALGHGLENEPLR